MIAVRMAEGTWLVGSTSQSAGADIVRLPLADWYYAMPLLGATLLNPLAFAGTGDWRLDSKCAIHLCNVTQCGYIKGWRSTSLLQSLKL